MTTVCVIARVRPSRTSQTSLWVDETERTVLQHVSSQALADAGLAAVKACAFSSPILVGAAQSEVMQAVQPGLLDAVFNGVSATVLCYGQTGSGKTYTLCGPRPEGTSGLPSGDPDRGLLSWASEFVFHQLGDVTNTQARTAGRATKAEVCMSVLEVYCEQPFDLLCDSLGGGGGGKSGGGGGGAAPPAGAKQHLGGTTLKVQMAGTSGVHVAGLTLRPVSCAGEVASLLGLALSRRKTSPTLANAESSRSHLLVTLNISRVDVSTGERRASKVTLVDLAGSEHAKRTGAGSERLLEASAINTSLSTLSRVITATVEKQGAALPGNAKAVGAGRDIRVPYRDSMLTRLLADSLGGGAVPCRTTVILCLSPDTCDYDQSRSTLEFGERAKLVVTRAVEAPSRHHAEKASSSAPAAAEAVFYATALRAAEGRLSLLTQALQAAGLDPQQLLAAAGGDAAAALAGQHGVRAGGALHPSASANVPPRHVKARGSVLPPQLDERQWTREEGRVNPPSLPPLPPPPTTPVRRVAPADTAAHAAARLGTPSSTQRAPLFMRGTESSAAKRSASAPRVLQLACTPDGSHPRADEGGGRRDTSPRRRSQSEQRHHAPRTPSVLPQPIAAQAVSALRGRPPTPSLMPVPRAASQPPSTLDAPRIAILSPDGRAVLAGNTAYFSARRTAVPGGPLLAGGAERDVFHTTRDAGPVHDDSGEGEEGEGVEPPAHAPCTSSPTEVELWPAEEDEVEVFLPARPAPALLPSSSPATLQALAPLLALDDETTAAQGLGPPSSDVDAGDVLGSASHRLSLCAHGVAPGRPSSPGLMFLSPIGLFKSPVGGGVMFALPFAAVESEAGAVLSAVGDDVSAPPRLAAAAGGAQPAYLRPTMKDAVAWTSPGHTHSFADAMLSPAFAVQGRADAGCAPHLPVLQAVGALLTSTVATSPHSAFSHGGRSRSGEDTDDVTEAELSQRVLLAALAEAASLRVALTACVRDNRALAQEAEELRGARMAAQGGATDGTVVYTRAPPSPLCALHASAVHSPAPSPGGARSPPSRRVFEASSPFSPTPTETRTPRPHEAMAVHASAVTHQLTQASVRADELAAALTEERSARLEAEEEAGSVRALLAEVQGDVGALQAHAACAEAALGASNAHAAALARRLEDSTAQCAGLGALTAALEAQVASLSAELEDTTCDLVHAQAERRVASTCTSGEAHQLYALLTSAWSAEAAQDALRDCATRAAWEEADAARAQAAAAERALQEAQARICLANAAIAVLQAQVVDAAERVASVEAYGQSLERRLVESDDHGLKLRAILAARESALTVSAHHAETEVEALHGELSVARAALADYEFCAFLMRDWALRVVEEADVEAQNRLQARHSPSSVGVEGDVSDEAVAVMAAHVEGIRAASSNDTRLWDALASDVDAHDGRLRCASLLTLEPGAGDEGVDDILLTRLDTLVQGRDLLACCLHVVEAKSIAARGALQVELSATTALLEAAEARAAERSVELCRLQVLLSAAGEGAADAAASLTSTRADLAAVRARAVCAEARVVELRASLQDVQAALDQQLSVEEAGCTEADGLHRRLVATQAALTVATRTAARLVDPSEVRAAEARCTVAEHRAEDAAYLSSLHAAWAGRLVEEAGGGDGGHSDEVRAEGSDVFNDLSEDCVCAMDVYGAAVATQSVADCALLSALGDSVQCEDDARRLTAMGEGVMAPTDTDTFHDRFADAAQCCVTELSARCALASACIDVLVRDVASLHARAVQAEEATVALSAQCTTSQEQLVRAQASSLAAEDDARAKTARLQRHVLATQAALAASRTACARLVEPAALHAAEGRAESAAARVSSLLSAMAALESIVEATGGTMRAQQQALKEARADTAVVAQRLREVEVQPLRSDGAVQTEEVEGEEMPPWHYVPPSKASVAEVHRLAQSIAAREVAAAVTSEAQRWVASTAQLTAEAAALARQLEDAKAGEVDALSRLAASKQAVKDLESLLTSLQGAAGGRLSGEAAAVAPPPPPSTPVPSATQLMDSTFGSLRHRVVRLVGMGAPSQREPHPTAESARAVVRTAAAVTDAAASASPTSDLGDVDAGSAARALLLSPPLTLTAAGRGARAGAHAPAHHAAAGAPVPLPETPVHASKLHFDGGSVGRGPTPLFSAAMGVSLSMGSTTSPRSAFGPTLTSPLGMRSPNAGLTSKAAATARQGGVALTGVDVSNLM